MNLLVVGANGLLGSNVVAAGRRRNWGVTGTYHSTRSDFPIPLVQFDLRDETAFAGVLEEHDPDAVVNCAAMTDVDACERHPQQARRLNGDAPGPLAALCEANGVGFVHASTDYVFDGNAGEPYTETAPPNPVQVYGETKLAGERAVREGSDSALVVRLSFVWGIHRGSGALTGFPSWVQSRLHSEDDVPLFTDQWVTPTRAGQAAEAVLDLLEMQGSGVYHVACRDCVTPFRFGRLLAESLGAGTDALVESSVDDVDREATRPRYSCLDVTRIEKALNRPQPSLQDDIDAVLDEL